MALSSISNTALAKIQANQQNAGAVSEKGKNKEGSLSSEKRFSEGNFDDSVTLSQSKKASESAKTLDPQAVESVLPRATAAILQQSTTAVSTQANISAKTAQEILADT